MFKRKLKDVYTLEDRRLDEKSEAIFNTRYRLKEVAKEVYQSQQVIMILPDGADKVAEIEYCSKLQHSLLAAIGAYDIARQDFNDYVKAVDKTQIHTVVNPITTTSHEILRNLFKKDC